MSLKIIRRINIQSIFFQRSFFLDLKINILSLLKKSLISLPQNPILSIFLVALLKHTKNNEMILLDDFLTKIFEGRGGHLDHPFVMFLKTDYIYSCFVIVHAIFTRII